MKVSIVTISYNQGRFLERALRSVLEQGYSDLEYIVVDAGSTDGSRETLARYRPCLSRLILEPDQGPADGLNKGFAAGSGEICGYLNADDAYLPGAIAEAVAEFQAHPEADVIYAHGLRADESDRIIGRIRSSSPFGARRYAFRSTSVLQPSTFFRRNALLQVGGFNSRNHTCWDGELLIHLARRGKKFRLVNRYWSIFRMHAGGISGSGRLQAQYWRDNAELFRWIMGRPERAADHLWRGLARLEKYARNPATALLRLADVFARPQGVRLLAGPGGRGADSLNSIAMSPDKALAAPRGSRA